MQDRLNRIESGVAGLDAILKGGFFRGGLYLIQGAPGTGKTTLANQLCFTDVARGGRAIYVTLLSEYHARLLQYIGRMSFFNEARIPDQLSYVSGFGVMREHGLGGLLALVRREIISQRASTLIIDGLIAAQRVAKNDQAFNEFVHELQGVAAATDCTIFLVTSSAQHEKVMPEHTMVDGILEMGADAFGWSSPRSLEVIKIRGTDFLRGKHAYLITSDGLTLYPRLEALLAVPSRLDRSDSDRISSGVERLDEMLGGGLPAASPTMLLGPTGVGKTTFGLHFLARCSEREPGLIVGFYEMPTRLMMKARQVCAPLVNLLEGGAVEMLWQPPTNDLLDAYAERLLSAVRRRNVQRLFIDGLGALLSAMGAKQRMRHFLPALMNELRVQGVTTLYTLETGDTTSLDSQPLHGDMSVLAENLLLLRYLEAGPGLCRYVSVLKLRDSGFDHRGRLFTLSDRGPVIEESGDGAAKLMGAGAVPRGADFGKISQPLQAE